MLFLIDEMLHGTNSHDRRIGAEAVVRGCWSAAPRPDHHPRPGPDGTRPERWRRVAANVHFEDQLADGQLLFDYRLRPGVVRKSNALELMRSVGLID